MQRLHYRQKQLIRAKNAGASIVLLIVAALEPARLVALYQEAEALGLEVLVETHNAAEFQHAQALGAKIIGVNNRDLKPLTFPWMSVLL